MTRNKMLMAAAASALALSVVGVPSVLAQTSGPGNSGAAPGNSQGNGPGNGRGCRLPVDPHPQPDRVRQPELRQAGRFSDRLREDERQRLRHRRQAGRPVRTRLAPAATSACWRRPRPAATAPSRSRRRSRRRPTSYKTMFAGDPSHDAAASNVVTVTVTGQVVPHGRRTRSSSMPRRVTQVALALLRGPAARWRLDRLDGAAGEVAPRGGAQRPAGRAGRPHQR